MSHSLRTNSHLYSPSIHPQSTSTPTHYLFSHSSFPNFTFPSFFKFPSFHALLTTYKTLSSDRIFRSPNFLSLPPFFPFLPKLSSYSSKTAKPNQSFNRNFHVPDLLPSIATTISSTRPFLARPPSFLAPRCTDRATASGRLPTALRERSIVQNFPRSINLHKDTRSALSIELFCYRSCSTSWSPKLQISAHWPPNVRVAQVSQNYHRLYKPTTII